MAFYLPNNVWRQVATGVGEVTIKAYGAVRVHFGSTPTGSEGIVYGYQTRRPTRVANGGGQAMWVKSADVGPPGINGYRSAVWVAGAGSFDAADVLPARVFTTSTGAAFTTAIWGQSEHQHILQEFDDVLPKEQLVAQDRVSFWWHDRTTDGEAGVQSVTLNDTTRGTNVVTAAMCAMANTFMRQLPGRDVHILMHTVSGTTPEELMDDSFVPSGTPRRWQDDWALNSVFEADTGLTVTHPWHSWFAAPGSWGANYGENMFTFIKGRDPTDGSLLSYSTGTPLTVNGISVSRTLRDIYTHEPVWIANSGAHVFIPTEDLENAVTVSGGGAQVSLTNKQSSTESWRDVIRNAALSAHFGPEVFPINGYQNGYDTGGGVWTDQAHPWGGADAGINRMARLIAHAILRGAGETSYTVPEITNAEWQPDGSYMEFWSDAGAITTERGGTGPGSDFPHWTDVLSVEIDGAPAERAEIQGNGRVRVFPNAGAFTSSSVIQFGRGGASGFIKHDEDAAAGLWDDYPLVDVGLPDVTGVPLKPLPDAAVLASTIVGAATFQTSNTGPVFFDTVNLPAGTTSLTARAVATMDADNANSSPSLFGIEGLYLDLAPVVSNGRLRLTVDDNGNTNLVTNDASASSTIQPGVQYEYLLKVDLVTGEARVYLDGSSTPVLNPTWTPNVGNEFWPTNRAFGFLGTSKTGATQFKGEIEVLEVWINEVTMDASVPSGTPTKRIAGSPATVNADAWKLLDDAT